MTRRDDQMIAIAMPGEDWALEGVFVGGDGEELGGAVIAPPHPLYGGSMDSPVVEEITWACRRASPARARACGACWWSRRPPFAEVSRIARAWLADG